MAICFERCAIFRNLGTMGDSEYFSNAIAHFRGFRHDDCSGAKLADDSLRAIDPVGSSFREMAVKTKYPPCPPLELKDTDHHEKLFEDACRGSLEDIKIDLQVLKDKSLPIPLQPLATVAADRGFPDILSFCLSQGATFDSDLDMAVLYTPKTPAMVDVLMAHNWRNIAFLETARRETGCAPPPPMPPMPVPPQAGIKTPQRPPMPIVSQVGIPTLKRPSMPVLPKGRYMAITAEQIQEWFGDIKG